MQINLQYYVIRWNRNTKEPYLYNVFNNSYVHEQTIKLIRAKRRGKITFDQFVEFLDGVFMHEFRTRVQYEYSISEPFHREMSETHKLDVYYQLKNNVRTIAYDVLRQYREQLKERGSD